MQTHNTHAKHTRQQHIHCPYIFRLHCFGDDLTLLHSLLILHESANLFLCTGLVRNICMIVCPSIHYTPYTCENESLRKHWQGCMDRGGFRKHNPRWRIWYSTACLIRFIPSDVSQSMASRLGEERDLQHCTRLPITASHCRQLRARCHR